VVLERSTIWGDPDMVWKCLGCGRETYEDAARQAEDEHLRRRIEAAQSGHAFDHPHRRSA
jgi:hypothetical protein